MRLNRNVDGKIAIRYKKRSNFYKNIIQLKHYLYHNADFYLKRKSSKLP